MTICNYCEKRESRSNQFPMPFTCNQCINVHTNYANNNDPDIITYIDSNGKHININNDTELNIETIDDKPTDTDALLTSLYCRVDDLNNELTEKNALIRSLIYNCEMVYCETDSEQETITSEPNEYSHNIDFEVESEWPWEPTIVSISDDTKANSTEIDIIVHQEEELEFAKLHQSKNKNLYKKEQETSSKLQRQLKEVRDEKSYDYINSSYYMDILQDKMVIYLDSTDTISDDLDHESLLTTTNNRYEWEKYSRGVAGKMMDKMGYKGKGLGKNENGIIEPIMIGTSNILGRSNHRIKRKRLLYILSSSMLNQMDERRLRSNTMDVKIQCHGGCTINCMYTHLQKMFCDRPDYILLHIGSNDCTSKISDTVLQEYKMLTEYINNKLPDAKLITSLPIARADCSRANAIQTNFKFKLHSLEFMRLDHSNVNLSHLGKKGLHLNNHGTKIVAKNIISLVKIL